MLVRRKTFNPLRASGRTVWTVVLAGEELTSDALLSQLLYAGLRCYETREAALDAASKFDGEYLPEVRSIKVAAELVPS